jgi:hypothetical protein
MTKLPYEQALERIRAEYQEMAGMKLTLEQVQRLSGVDKSVCRQVLDSLVNAKFLFLGTDGSYTRSVDTSIRLRTVKAGWNASVQSPASRRAS